MAARTDYACTKWVGSRRCGRDGKWDGKRMRCDQHRAPTLGRATKVKREQRRRYRDAIRGLPIPPPERLVGTKHARREREWGRMAFYSSLWCMVREMAMNGNAWPSHREAMLACSGPVEVAHLGERAGWRRCPDSETAPICRKHHRLNGIDGGVGGRAKWYVELGRDGQREFRDRLIQFASSYWNFLTDAGRAHWDEVAAARRGRR